MKAKFTKAPWKTVKLVLSNDVWDVVSVSDHPVPVCRCYSKNAENDAMLIAVAPELHQNLLTSNEVMKSLITKIRNEATRAQLIELVKENEEIINKATKSYDTSTFNRFA